MHPQGPGQYPQGRHGPLNDTTVSVSPTVSRDQAAAILTAPSTSFPARLWSRPIHLTRVELIYLPYYFFDVKLSQEACAEDQCERTVGLAIDAILGASVFFVEDTLVRSPGCDGATCAFMQSANEAREAALEEYRWLLLEHGLRNKRKVSVEEISEPEKVHYPFWVVYFKKRGSYDFKALDAVSGEIQGIKMRKVFLSAFRQMDDNGSRDPDHPQP